MNVGLIKCQKVHKLTVAKVKKLQWMSEHTRQHKIKNKCNREIVRGDTIEGKTVESCLRWLMVMSHARRTEASIKKVDHMEERVRESKTKKKNSIKLLKWTKDLTGLSESLVYDNIVVLLDSG